jgi:hypothetical protein
MSRADLGYVTNLRIGFIGILRSYFVNDTQMVPAASVITDIAFVLTFNLCCVYIAWSLYFKIFLVDFLVTFSFPDVIMPGKRLFYNQGSNELRIFHTLKENVQHQRNSALSNTFVVLRNPQFFQLNERCEITMSKINAEYTKTSQTCHKIRT